MVCGDFLGCFSKVQEIKEQTEGENTCQSTDLMLKTKMSFLESWKSVTSQLCHHALFTAKSQSLPSMRLSGRLDADPGGPFILFLSS